MEYFWYKWNTEIGIIEKNSIIHIDAGANDLAQDIIEGNGIAMFRENSDNGFRLYLAGSMEGDWRCPLDKIVSDATQEDFDNAYKYLHSYESIGLMPYSTKEWFRMQVE